MSNIKSEKAEKLRAISKCISEMVLPERAQSLSLQKAGHYIEDALNLGAFNRPEHTALRTEIKVLLSQPKEEMEPHITAWAGTVSQLKPKKSQFPSVDIVKDFPSDRKLVAKAILEEAEAIEQTDLAKLKPAETEQNVTPAISIQNSNVILGGIQKAENLQVGDNARIYKHEKTEEKKKGILSRIPYWVYLLVSSLAALFACIHYWPEIHQKLQSLFSH